MRRLSIFPSVLILAAALAGPPACSGGPASTAPGIAPDGIQRVEIAVAGEGYSPQVVEVSEGSPVELVFELKNPSTCLEEVVLDDFNIRKKLSVGEKVPVRLENLKKGTYTFHCGMNMASGSIRVK